MVAWKIKDTPNAVQILKGILTNKGIKLSTLSRSTGIKQKRIYDIFGKNQVALTADELILICKHANIDINIFL